MLRRGSFLFCASTATAATSKSATPRQFDSVLVDKARCDRFEAWCKTRGITYDGVCLNIHEDTGRGMKAIRKFYTGQTVVRVPLHPCTISEETLVPEGGEKKGADKRWASDALIAANVPSLERVKSVMMLHGCHDPMMYRHFHLALAVAVERMNPNSEFAPYFDILPHPAIDDELVMALHKDSLNLGQKIEWQDFLNEFHLMTKEMCSRWPQHPPEQVILWAWRTVLARNNPFPNRKFEQNMTKGKLHFSSVFELNRAKNYFQKLKSKYVDGEKFVEEYQLIPTLTPVVDLVSHVATGNVSIDMRTETNPDGSQTPFIELLATTTIMPGDVIGYRFARTHGVPFTLFRFGFLPL